MGNPRKPAHLKVVAGTDRPDRALPSSVDLPLVEAVPEPPDWLPNAHAVKEWKRLAPLRRKPLPPENVPEDREREGPPSGGFFVGVRSVDLV
jgi:phage terminase small subunit